MKCLVTNEKQSYMLLILNYPMIWPQIQGQEKMFLSANEMACKKLNSKVLDKSNPASEMQMCVIHVYFFYVLFFY